MRYRRRAIAFATVNEAPIGALNTTPLIDVMLVLLIMFIVTIPLMTHAVKINLPRDGETQAEPEIHELALDPAGRLSWDGTSLAESTLPGRLAAFRAAAPDGILRFRAEPDTRY